MRIRGGLNTFSKIRGTVRAYSGQTCDTDFLVDSGAYRMILSCELKDRLSLGRGQWPKEEAVMGDGTVRTGEIIDLQLLFIDEAERQLFYFFLSVHR